MIAAFIDKDHVHFIHWTGRVRLHAEAVAYCSQTQDAGAGVYQIPDAVLTSGASFKIDGKPFKACPRCRLAVQSAVG